MKYVADEDVLRAVFADFRELEPTQTEVRSVLTRLRSRKQKMIARGRIAVVIALLAFGGVAAARALFSASPTGLALHDIECLGAEISSRGLPPAVACAQALHVPASTLVACAADRSGYSSVEVFRDDGSSTCRSRGLHALPAQFAAAQKRVELLVQAMTGLQSSAYCQSTAGFARHAQAILDQLDWPGWQVRAEPEPASTRAAPGGGNCAQFASAGGGRTYADVSGSMDIKHHALWIGTGPPPSLANQLGALNTQLLNDSAHACFTRAALEARISTQLADRHLSAAFAITQEPKGAANIAQTNYDRGCTILWFGLEPASQNPRLIDAWLAQRNAPAPAAPEPTQNAYAPLR